MQTTILNVRGSYYIEHAGRNDVYTDGPYSLPVARYLAPGASVQQAAPWLESAQRCLADAAD